MNFATTVLELLKNKSLKLLLTAGCKGVGPLSEGSKLLSTRVAVLPRKWPGQHCSLLGGLLSHL